MNHKIKQSALRSGLVCSLLASSTVFAWGSKGHMTVNQVALSMVANPQAKKFLDANGKSIIRLAVIPDIKWKSGAHAEDEKPMHWFQMDEYNSTSFGDKIADVLIGRAQSELSKDFVIKNGSAMWRVSDFYGQLMAAIKKNDFVRVVQIAGVMGHYVGDMTQPMHNSSDYDGQSIHKPGVHKYYETTLVDEIDSQHLVAAVQKVAGERRSGLERSIGNQLDTTELQHISYNEASDAYSSLNTLLEHMDSNSPDDEWLTSDLEPRIARAAALLGKIWDVAFTTAGTTKLPMNALTVKDPDWMPMVSR